MIVLGQWAISVSKTVFVEVKSVEEALAAGQKMIDAGEGLVAISIEQMDE